MKQTIFWDGLKNERLECYLQPIYDVKKNKVNVAEALLRVSDGNSSFYDTEELISFAESVNCVSKIDLWVLEEVCKNMRKLEAIGIERVNVNLSPKSYMDEGLLADIKMIMQKYQVKPTQIWFELTELTEVEDKDRLKHLITKLTDKGFQFALDDFGKGNSNLIRLFDFPFRCIKFDKELVWKLKDSEMTKTMLSLIVKFAHEYQICVTAEGIEDRELARILIEMDCDYLQGYLISKPVSVDEFILFVKSYLCRPLPEKEAVCV